MPVHGSNGRSGDSAAVAAPSSRAEASEQATSSVLALDGWGRLEPERHDNGAAPAVVEPVELAEPEPAPEVEAEAEVEPQIEVEPGPRPASPPPSLDADAWRRRVVAVGEQRLGRLIAEAQRLPWVGEQAEPGLRLFGSALVFGLAVGAVVGAALRWLELRSAPPPAPPVPPDDLAERLHRAWVAFSMSEGEAGEAPHARRSCAK